jgi:Cadherin-like domain/Bacterial Ig domain
MRKGDLKKHFRLPAWLLIVFAVGTSMFGFLHESHANEAPVVMGQAELSTPEETPLTIMLTDLIVSDPDSVYPTDFTLTMQGGSNYSVSGNTITPSADFSGDLEVPVTVNDGTVDSAVFTLSVTVTAVNDPPVISSIPDQVTDEDTSLGPIAFTVGDPETPAENLTVTATSGNQNLVPDANIALGGSGVGRTLTVTPAADVNGVAEIRLTVTDGVDSATCTFLLTVVPGNDAPTAIGLSKNTVDENQPVGTLVGVFSTEDPDIG